MKAQVGGGKKARQWKAWAAIGIRHMKGQLLWVQLIKPEGKVLYPEFVQVTITETRGK